MKNYIEYYEEGNIFGQPYSVKKPNFITAMMETIKWIVNGKHKSSKKNSTNNAEIPANSFTTTSDWLVDNYTGMGFPRLSSDTTYNNGATIITNTYGRIK